MQFSITTEVDAPADVVFAVLGEVERWPEWTPTVTKVERIGDPTAPLALGGRLRIVQPKVPPAEWTITALEPGRGFRLLSRSPGATVEANHWIEPVGAGANRSRVTLSVTFSGFLGRIIGWLMRGLNNRYLALEAAGLKQRCEERATVSAHGERGGGYSLWRGGKCLGHLKELGPVRRHERRAGAFGILLPGGDMTGASSMMQARVEIFPGSPTFQHPLPVEWIGDPNEPITPMYPSSGALEPLSPEAARGVPPEELFEILDEHGKHVEAHLITLQQHRFADAADAKEWHDRSGIQGDAQEFWMVTFGSNPER